MSHQRKATEIRDGLLHQIGARIFRRRHELGWTQNDLAQRLGIAPVNITRIEHGGRNLTIDTLCKLAVALDMTVGELVIGTPPTAPGPKT